MILILKTSHYGPSDAMHNLSQLPRLLSKEVCFISHGDQHASIDFLLLEFVSDFEKVRVVNFTLNSMAYLNQFSLALSGHPGSGTAFYVEKPVELSLMAMRR
ncbi:hypothetical protein Tco_0007535 [Tanacetum coccineum]